MTTVIDQGIRKSRKVHRCFECCRDIPIGSDHGFQSNVYDGRAYTLHRHIDCGKCAAEYRNMVANYYDDEGFPPLRDLWCECDYLDELTAWRGYYPHVVARMELTDQLREARK